MNPIIPTASIVTMAVSAVIALALPIGTFLLLRRSRSLRIVPALVGAAVFVVFALVLESTVISALFRSESAAAFLTSRVWIYALFGGFMAGLFEESGRLCAFLFLLRRRHGKLGGAVSYGIGHGGIECILLAALPLIANIVVAVMVNTSGVESLRALLPLQAVVVNQTVAGLAETSSITFLASGLERIIAFSFHIAASVLVWMAAASRGPWGLYFLAILFHMATNFMAGLYQMGAVTSLWLVELVTAAVVAAICLVTYTIYERCSQNYTPLLDYNPTDFGL